MLIKIWLLDQQIMNKWQQRLRRFCGNWQFQVKYELPIWVAQSQSQSVDRFCSEVRSNYVRKIDSSECFETNLLSLARDYNCSGFSANLGQNLREMLLNALLMRTDNIEQLSNKHSRSKLDAPKFALTHICSVFLAEAFVSIANLSGNKLRPSERFPFMFGRCSANSELNGTSSSAVTCQLWFIQLSMQLLLHRPHQPLGDKKIWNLRCQVETVARSAKLLFAGQSSLSSTKLDSHRFDALRAMVMS